MIETKNPELDAAYASLQAECARLVEQNALKDGNIAGLKEKLRDMVLENVRLKEKLSRKWYPPDDTL